MKKTYYHCARCGGLHPEKSRIALTLGSEFNVGLCGRCATAVQVGIQAEFESFRSKLRQSLPTRADLGSSHHSASLEGIAGGRPFRVVFPQRRKWV